MHICTWSFCLFLDQQLPYDYDYYKEIEESCFFIIFFPVTFLSFFSFSFDGMESDIITCVKPDITYGDRTSEISDVELDGTKKD